MTHKSIYAGETLPLKFRLKEGASFADYRLDVYIYPEADAADSGLMASTEPSQPFATPVELLDEHTALLVVKSSMTNSWRDKVVKIEERYTHKATGTKRMFAYRVVVEQARIGSKGAGISETDGATTGYLVTRDLLFNHLSSYDAAVLEGFQGTEEEWLELQKMEAVANMVTPVVDIIGTGEKLYYHITNIPPDVFERFGGEYKIGLRRYRKTNRVHGADDSRLPKAWKKCLVDDSSSTYHRLSKGDKIPYADGEVNRVFWTDIKVIPTAVALNCISGPAEFPLTAQQIIERFVYFTKKDADGDMCLSDIDEALASGMTAIDAARMMKVAGKRRLAVPFTDELGRPRVNCSIICDLVIYRDIKVQTSKGVSWKRLYAASPPFRVCLTTPKGAGAACSFKTSPHLITYDILKKGADSRNR